MSLPLSKYYDSDKDLPELAEELLIVDEHFTKASSQSEHRRWEYAMALRALEIWGLEPAVAYDVGGAGSPFQHMVNVQVIDPHLNMSLSDYMAGNPILADAVFCLSVLEHVDDLDRFLYHLSCLVAPGGLLFLTVDCCGCGLAGQGVLHASTQDPHHFNSMRERIFTPTLWWGLLETVKLYNFTPLGEEDFDHYAPRLYGGATDPGYSFASLALVKRS